MKKPIDYYRSLPLDRGNKLSFLYSTVLYVTLNSSAYLLGNCCWSECSMLPSFSFLSSVVKLSAPL